MKHSSKSKSSLIEKAITFAKSELGIQLFRYGIVGITSNALLYVLYIGLTYFDILPAIALAIVYVVAIIYSYFGNARWSFQQQRKESRVVSYFITYAAAYFINAGLLLLIVQTTSLPHQFVQFLLIPVMAVFIFLALRYWVFRQAVDKLN